MHISLGQATTYFLNTFSSGYILYSFLRIFSAILYRVLLTGAVVRHCFSKTPYRRISSQDYCLMMTNPRGNTHYAIPILEHEYTFVISLRVLMVQLISHAMF